MDKVKRSQSNSKAIGQEKSAPPMKNAFAGRRPNVFLSVIIKQALKKTSSIFVCQQIVYSSFRNIYSFFNDAFFMTIFIKRYFLIINLCTV